MNNKKIHIWSNIIGISFVSAVLLTLAICAYLVVRFYYKPGSFYHWVDKVLA